MALNCNLKLLKVYYKKMTYKRAG